MTHIASEMFGVLVILVMGVLCLLVLGAFIAILLYAVDFIIDIARDWKEDRKISKDMMDDIFGR